eukprot:8548645-Pyramimonas_sp.AAC.1
MHTVPRKSFEYDEVGCYYAAEIRGSIAAVPARLRNAREQELFGPKSRLSTSAQIQVWTLERWL